MLVTNRNHCHPGDNISSWEFVKHLVCMFNTFYTMSTCSPRHFLKEVSDPNPALTTWIFFPSFRTAHGIAQALRKLTNMTLYGSKPSFSICYKSSRTCFYTVAENIFLWWLSMRIHLIQVICQKFGVHLPCYHIEHTYWWVHLLLGHLSLIHLL